MAEVGMRSVINGQPLQFDLNLHGQQKVFTFQVENKTNSLAIEWFN